MRTTCRFVDFPSLQLITAAAGLCLSLACSSDPAPPGGGAGQSAGGASGGATPSSGGATSGGTSSGGATPSSGGATSGGATSGGTTATGGSTQSGGASGSAGASGAAGSVASGGAPGQGGSGNAGKGGGGGAGSGGTPGATGGGGNGGVGKGGGGAGGASGGSAGKGGSAGSAGSSGSAGAAGSGGGGTYNPCPTNGMPCKIVPMGDSITVGIGTGATGGGYRIELFKQATAAGKKLTFDGVATQMCSISAPSNPPSGFVNKHSACSGWTIQQIAGMVSGSVALKPDIILLIAGTNDTGSASGAPARLGSLLDQIFSADSHVLVVVAKLTPFPGANAAVTQISNGIATQVQTRAAAGKHVMLVDMSTGYPDNSLPDGIHPNQAGYVWMANTWYKAVGSLLP